jgi:hypothetical protein
MPGGRLRTTPRAQPYNINPIGSATNEDDRTRVGLRLNRENLHVAITAAPAVRCTYEHSILHADVPQALRIATWICAASGQTRSPRAIRDLSSPAFTVSSESRRVRSDEASTSASSHGGMPRDGSGNHRVRIESEPDGHGEDADVVCLGLRPGGGAV